MPCWLKLDTPDLATALRKTIEEFSGRLGKPIGLIKYKILNRLIHLILFFRW